MSELTINERLAQERSQKRTGITRRNFLRAATVTGGALAVTGVKGIVDSLSRIGATEQSVTQASKYEPKQLVEDEVELLKGFQVFSLPNIPKDGNPNEYLINSGDLLEISGKNIQGQDKITLKESFAVEAQTPDGPSGEKGPWIRIRVKRNVGGSPLETYGFISLSTYSSATVKRKLIGGFTDLTNKNGVFETKDGRKFTDQNTGNVVLPQTK